MSKSIPKDLCAVIENTFKTDIDNFDLTLHEGNKKGEGYFGDIIFLAIKDKETNEKHQLVIKKVLAHEQESYTEFMSNSFNNEICFYTDILPTFQSFQKSLLIENPFENVPRCFGTSSEKGKETLILENLKYKNFEVYPKVKPVSKQMYQEIFKVYGKYHALSFALKGLRPQEFQNLTARLKNNWIGMIEAGLLSDPILNQAKSVREILQKNNNDELLIKFQKYVENGDDIFKNSAQYTGSHGVIVHGDAWTNNMMFKFKESRQLQEINLLDFQFIFLGSPAHDLSYCLYTGANKDILDSLQDLLEIYYKSLTENLKQYGLNAEQLYPFELLKEEWKKYCSFGFIISSLTWTVRYLKEDEVEDARRNSNNEEKKSNAYMEEHYEVAIYNLVKHMYENSLL